MRNTVGCGLCKTRDILHSKIACIMVLLIWIIRTHESNDARIYMINVNGGA